MGQQLPNFQNMQFLQGLTNPQPPGLPQGMNPLQGLAQGIPGIDPKLMGQAQQQVANPDAGDALSIFPGPKEMAIGGVSGIVAAMGLSAFMEQGKKGPFDGKIPGFAQWIDELAPVRKLSNAIDKSYTKIENPILKEALFTSILKDVPNRAGQKIMNQADQEAIDQAVQKALGEMEKRHVEKTLAKFPNRFDDKLRTYYQETFLKDFKANGLQGEKGYAARLEKTFAERVKGLAPDSADYRKIEAGKKLRTVTAADVFDFARKDAKLPESIQNFDQSMSQAKAQMHYLEQLKKRTPEQEKILARLRGVKERISGLKGHYRPSYEAQARLTAQLKSRGVGPIGRTIALGGQYLQRIFNGETMSMGGGGKGIFSAAMAGPLMAGALIFGQSINKASKAQDGEKTKTFFHDFFGTGIANFIGWELGRKWLNSIGASHRILGRFGTKRPFDNAIGSRLPIFGERCGKGAEKLFKSPTVGAPFRFLFGGVDKVLSHTVGLPFHKTFSGSTGRFMSSVAGKGLGGMMARMTLGGLATELMAMFVFGSAFQWVGEKVSHLIFGKPSQDSIDGKKPQAPGLAQQAGQPPQAPGQAQGVQPFPGFNPQTMQQRAYGLPNQPFSPAMAAGQGQGQPTPQSGFYGQPPQQPQANPIPTVPSANQRFSLTPSMISQNAAAGNEQQIQQQIMNQQKTAQQKSNGRDNFFNPALLNGNPGF